MWRFGQALSRYGAAAYLLHPPYRNRPLRFLNPNFHSRVMYLPAICVALSQIKFSSKKVLRFVHCTCILLRCGSVVAAHAHFGRFLPRLGPLVATQAVSFFASCPHTEARQQRGADQIRPAAILIVSANTVALKKNDKAECAATMRRIGLDVTLVSEVAEAQPMAKEKYRKSP